MSMQHKSFSFQVKAVDDEQGLIEAYGSVFDIEDQGGDIVRPGAFKRTISNSKGRVQAGKAKYLAVMLWQHNPDAPIGGWTDLKEDTHGLLCKGQIVLSTQQGKEAYELIKNGVIQEFSIGYDIPNGGASYDSKEQVRNLTELRLWEVSPVTFAMNQEALLTSVKSLEAKAVCGNTSGPIGSRDESWDGGKAKRQIWQAAYNSESGKINTSLAKKYFMVCNGDAQQKGSYSYPFWYAGDSPHICVGAVKAIAAAAQGARNASAPDGIKSKVETLYRRINSKYPDAEPLTPPWKDDGKGSHMDRETKDFHDNYRERQIRDWYSELYSMTSALCETCQDAFKMGDQPLEDIMAALNGNDDSPGFIAELQDWIQEGIELDYSNYLEEMEDDDDRPRYYMSRDGNLSRKAGRAISAANAGKIQDHIDSLHDMADDHLKAVKAHVKAIHTAAVSMTGMLPVSDGDGGKEPGNEDDQQKANELVTSLRSARNTLARSSKDTVTEDEIVAALGKLRTLKLHD